MLTFLDRDVEQTPSTKSLLDVLSTCLAFVVEMEEGGRGLDPEILLLKKAC
jgi:hypothetical protein